MEWPFEDNGNGKTNGNASFQNIADYLSQRKICLMINLPMRLHRTTPAITKGYITRRMAVEYSIPLITDIKCAKLAVKVRIVPFTALCMYVCMYVCLYVRMYGLPSSGC